MFRACASESVDGPLTGGIAVVAQNRVAIVTGAGKGLGFACAEALLDAGNMVVAADITPPDRERFPEGQRGRLLPYELDVTDEKRAAELLDMLKATWGPVGILVNNAGISPKKDNGLSRGLMEVDLAEMEQVMRVNLLSILRLCQLTAGHMKDLGWGRIVNMTSMGARRRGITGPSYTCSKSALIGLNRILAAELGPFGVTSNCVAPGRILTDMVLQAGEEVNRAFAEQTPLRRLGKPEEVASVVAFLCSEGAGFVSGAIIDVNGGIFMP